MATASSVKIKCMFIKSVNLRMLNSNLKYLLKLEVKKHDLYWAAAQSQL